jgi:excisionase family DNA binding protein
MTRKSRAPAKRIVDPATHPDRTVCLAVAADYLGLDHRTVRARIESGELHAWKDGKVYGIAVEDLVRYDRCRRLAS